MGEELTKKVKAAYKNTLRSHTLKEGRLLSLFTVFLYFSIIYVDYINGILDSVILARLVGVTPVTIFVILAYSSFFHRFPKLIIPTYAISLSFGILHMSLISIIMYALNLEESPIYHILPAGFVFAVTLTGNFSYGARRIMIYVLPTIILGLNLTFIILQLNHHRFLVMIDIVTLFSIIIMRRQEWYEYQATELLELKESELIQSNESLKLANQHLINVNRALSHDLKTPLRNVGSFAQLASRKLKKGEYSELDEYLEFIRTGVKTMYKLLEDMLFFSNLSHEDTMKQALVNLQEIVLNLKQGYQFQYDKNGLHFEIINPLPLIKGNETKLFFLFQNIFDNALKYNESTIPSIIIDVEVQEQQYLISIMDNGIGIEKEYLEKIFEMFQRLDTAKYEGSGIGLATCREIVQSHGGSIWVDSKPGTGSTFYITFPKFTAIPRAKSIA